MNKLDLRQLKQGAASNGQVLVWANSSNTWAASSDVILAGISATTITATGNVSTGDLTTGNVTTKALVPDANITYDIGTASKRYKDLYLSGNTIYLGSIQLKANGESLIIANSSGGTIDTSTGDTDIAGYLNVTSSGYFGGNVTAIGTANVTGVADFGNNVTIHGYANVTGTAQFGDDVTINGDLTVTGNTTYINTTTVNISDNILALNADASGSPTEDAGIEVNRGTSANVSIKWNETTDKWQSTVDGTTFLNIATNNDVTTAYSNAVANATFYANAAAAGAYTNAANYADGVAANAYANAASYADTASGTAYSNAVTFASNATNISSGTLDSARLPAIANIASQLYVGANLYIDTSSIVVGNSSLNTHITATYIDVDGTIDGGNTTIVGYANVSNYVAVGGNMLINTSSIKVSTGTDNTTITAAGVNLSGNLVVNGNSSVSGLLTVSASGIKFSDNTVQVSAALDPVVYAIALG